MISIPRHLVSGGSRLEETGVPVAGCMYYN